MPKRYTAAEIIAVLSKLGITQDRRGGEDIFTGSFRGSNRTIPIPRKHGGKEIPQGTFSSILRQANLTKVEFDKLYEGQTTKAELENDPGPRPHGS